MVRGLASHQSAWAAVAVACYRRQDACEVLLPRRSNQHNSNRRGTRLPNTTTTLGLRRRLDHHRLLRPRASYREQPFRILTIIDCPTDRLAPAASLVAVPTACEQTTSTKPVHLAFPDAADTTSYLEYSTLRDCTDLVTSAETATTARRVRDRTSH